MIVTESIAAIVAAVSSALISALVAWIIARKSVQTELNAQMLGAQEALLSKLVDRRHSTYPCLYKLLSEFLKGGEKEIPLSRLNELEILKSEFDKWDSENAILMGPETINVCYRFRKALYKAIREMKENSNEWQSSESEIVKILFSELELLELRLRSDLGVYGVKFKQAPDSLVLKRIDKY